MILVTGATGFIGRSLMRALDYHGLEAKPFVGRIQDPNALRENLVDVETVIHLASAESHGRNRALQQVDVNGTRRLVQEAERLGIGHIIYVSRLGAERKSAFPVLRAKGEAEHLIRHSTVTSTILRSATLFGRDDHFLTPIASLAIWNWPFVWLPSGGKGLLQPLWVEDLVRCIITISDPLDLQAYRGRIYQLAGEERFHYEEIVRLVLDTAALNRIPLPIRNRLVRNITTLFFGWRRNPPITLYFLDRLIVPEIAPLNTVHRTFGFHPARLHQQITYLRQPRLGRYIWRS